MTRSVLDEYRSRLQAGDLDEDPAQAAAAERLDALADALGGHEVVLSPRRRWRNWLRMAAPGRASSPRGLYLWGGPGRGKTLLMDLFFQAAAPACKRRVHFNAFMLEVHTRIHEARSGGGSGEDPIPNLAHRLATEAALLCLDELIVTDLPDAMVLYRLFEQLWEHGVVVVATSNRAPRDLYRDGLQRELFLPFLDLLERQVEVQCLDGGRDHRRERVRGLEVYHRPLGPASDRALEAALQRLTRPHPLAPQVLDVGSRTLTVPRAGAGVGYIDFDALCRNPLGAADYIALSRAFHTVLVSRIPRMGPQDREVARRFVWLVDELYNQRVRLLCSAAAEPDELYQDGTGAFEFQRTSSRLEEMRSQEWVQVPRGDEYRGDE